MPNLPSWQDLFRAARDEVLARNAQLSREAVERDGTDANAIVAGMAAIGDEVVGQVATALKGAFLDTAEGEALRKLVFDRYGLVAKEASAALGTVEFTSTAASGAAFNIPVNTVVQTADGIQYVTTAAVTYPLGSVGPVAVPIRATLAGLAYQARANTVRSIVTQIAGAPVGWAVNNPLATAGASDAETDTSLRERARNFWVNARRGTLGALVNGAKEVPGVERATAFETLSTTGMPDYITELVLADAFTDQLASYSTVPPLYDAQAQSLATTVYNYLTNNDIRAAGLPVNVSVAQVVLQPVLLSLAYAAGADVIAVQAAAVNAVVNYTNDLAPQETWVRADALGALAQVAGLAYTGNEVVAPSGNVVAAGALQVIRTSPNIVTQAG
jgi:hypothetical protein